MLSDLHEYAEKIGIDLDTEKHLLYLAEDALHTKLPANWKPWSVCVKNERKKIFFFQFFTRSRGMVLFQHSDGAESVGASDRPQIQTSCQASKTVK